MINFSNDKTISIVCIVLTIVLLLSTIISLCIFEVRSKGVSPDDIQVYVDGKEFDRSITVETNSSYDIEVKTQKEVKYYLYVDSKFGYISENKVLIVNDELESTVAFPILITIIKDNYAKKDYIYYLSMYPN